MAEKQYEQHSATKSILLHLIPGIPIIAGGFLFSLPVFSRMLGIFSVLNILKAQEKDLDSLMVLGS